MAKTPKLVIDEEFKSLLPPLAPDEYEQLDANCVDAGAIIDPIAVWDGIVLDGHNRLAIAEERFLPYQTIDIPVASREEAIEWILAHQKGRRNLTPEQKKLYLGRAYNALKKSHGGIERLPRGQIGPLEENQGKTANLLSKTEKVSPRTIKRSGAYAKAVDGLAESAKKGIESGAIKATESQVKTLAKMPTEKQNEIARSVRVEGKTLEELLPKSKGANPTTETRPSKSTTKEKSPAKLVDQLTRKFISPLVRGIDNVATMNGGKGKWHKQANDALNSLIGATKEMRKGNK